MATYQAFEKRNKDEREVLKYGDIVNNSEPGTQIEMESKGLFYSYNKDKSRCYIGIANEKRIMFLNIETVLGRQIEKEILKDEQLSRMSCVITWQIMLSDKGRKMGLLKSIKKVGETPTKQTKL